MEFNVRTLTDVNDHSLAMSEWNQNYIQLKSGRFESLVIRIRAANFLFFEESMNLAVAQFGRSPQGFQSIAMPLRRPARTTFQNRRVDGYALLLLDADEEFRFYTPESTHYLGVSIPSFEMQVFVAAMHGDEAIRLLEQSVLPIPAAWGERVGNELARFVAVHQCQPQTFENPVASKRFRDEILSALLELFNLDGSLGRRDVTHATYAEIVRRSECILQEHAEQPQTILDLCVQLRCSRRTLQTSFQRVTNASPVEYLRSVRLNGVRRLLQSTNGEELLIGDAAARWGFTHPSYFGRKYRELFGELPSQTLRRS